MSKDYHICITDEGNTLGVTMLPDGITIKSDSKFKIRLGYIEHLDKNPTFHCIDSDRMTLDIMKSIIFQWERYHKNVLDFTI